MLYVYPSPAFESNWLHRLLLDCIEEVFRGVAEGRSSKPWTAFVPAGKLARIQSARGFDQHYDSLLQLVTSMARADAAATLQEVVASRNYTDVLRGIRTYPSLPVQPPVMDALLKFLHYGFSLLSRVGHSEGGSSIRDSRYIEVFESESGWRVCPFCGISRLDAPFPIMPRHPLDHYLAFVKYPLYASDLMNLVTMCERCNSSFKGAKDMIRTEEGHPRRCIDPHAGPEATVSLSGSVPFAGEDGFKPVWNIQLLPDVEEVATWAQVFRIRERYEHNILDVCYKDWVQEFAQFIQASGQSIATVAELIENLSRYAASLLPSGDVAFLKSAAFEMLSEASAASNEVGTRLLNVLRPLLSFA